MELVNNTQTLLHSNIKSLRRKLNLSQEELANKLGLNRGNIASYENGTAEPKICNLLKISHLFGISIIDLTQKDLRNEDTLSSATNNYQKFSNNEKELLLQFMQRADELQDVFQSVYTCQKYKTRNLHELPKEMQMFVVNFEQLYDAAQSLMRNHQALLNFVKNRG